MEPGMFEGLVGKANAGSSTAQIELLQSMRLHRVHQPELAVIHGGRLLSHCPRKLGDDVWTVMEQVFLASVDMGADGWRDYCLKALEKRFPGSVRVEKLRAIFYESTDEYGEAKKIYDKLIKEKPEDCSSRKRLIAMHKQKGKFSEAIEEINKYLAVFSIDSEVWHELAELYIEASSLTRAVFCFEELVMSNPRSMYYVLTYAELLYSTGDFEMSRKYFSFASYLDDACLRALWGLYYANIAMADKEKNKEKIDELQKFTIQKIKAVYKTAGGTHSKLALAVLNREQ